MEVASELVSRRKAAGDIGVGQPRWRLGRQQRELDTLRKPQLFFDSLLVTANLFVQARVFDSHGRLAREQREQLFVLLGERVELGTLEIEYPDASLLDEHRDHELGARVG